MNRVGGIITGGLGLPAGQGMIINRWHLTGGPGLVITMTGGSYPLEPGQIHDLYQPVDYKSPLNVGKVPLTRQDPSIPRNIVKIEVKIGEKQNTREFLVPIERANVIIKVLNVTARVGTVIGTNIRKVTDKIKITVKNLRKK